MMAAQTEVGLWICSPLFWILFIVTASAANNGMCNDSTPVLVEVCSKYKAKLIVYIAEFVEVTVLGCAERWRRV